MMSKEYIQSNIHHCLMSTDFNIGQKQVGKVRDIYFTKDDQDNEIVILISTDRQSAFDRSLGCIPFKGQVLSSTSAWWFKKTESIIGNHLIAQIDPNVIIAKKCQVLPIEFIVRGYITGSTSTSLWQHYNSGHRKYCGIDLPNGMKKNEKLAQNILTPTTKEQMGDRPITPQEIIDGNWLTQKQWEYISKKSFELFAFGQQQAYKNGLILVDTKYEFGIDQSTGDIVLIDEIHTPDSSRFWLKETYNDCLQKNLEPDSFDKEFFRLWFVRNCDPYHDKQIPQVPDDLIIELSQRYIKQYEMMTQDKLLFEQNGSNMQQRIKKSIETYLHIKA